MTTRHPSHPLIDGFLKEVRFGLRGIPPGTASEIIEELRTHIIERMGESGPQTEEAIAAVLGRLGRPQELAASYVAENIVTRAQLSFSPWLVLRGIVRWAGISLAGCWVLMVSLIGYALAGCLAVSALMKPLAPSRVGLWHLNGDPDNFSLILGLSGGPAPEGIELLGWWIVPLGLLIGVGLFLITARFGLWALKKFRARRLAP